MRNLKALRIALLGLCVAALAACGGRPESFQRQYDEAISAEAPTPGAVGWWRYLAGDKAGAEADFAGTPDSPLRALGRARLALDALDDEAAVTAAQVALRLSEGDPELKAVRLLAGLWARASVARLPAGHGVEAAPGQPVALKTMTHTVRVSFLPFLDMRRLAQEGVAPVDSDVMALGKRWALSEKAKPDRDGLIITQVPLAADVAHLEIHVDGPMMAWRGGRVVVSDPVGRFPASIRRFSASGEGPLILAWAAPRAPKIWRWPQGAPQPPQAGWLARAWAVQRALIDEDPPEVTRLLAGAPDTPAFEGWRAEASEQDPARSGRRRRDAARIHWQAAAPLLGPRATLALARLDMAGGDQAEALRRVQAVIEAAPQAHEALRLRFELLLSLGDRAGARAALSEALGTAPDACDLLEGRATLAEQEGNPEARLPLVELYAQCDAPIKAIELLLRLERFEAALTRLKALEGHGEEARALEARALVALGRLEAATQLYARGKAAEDALALADLRAAAVPGIDPNLSAVFPAADDPDTDLSVALKALVMKHPRAREAIEIVRARPAWSPFAEIAVDTEATIRAYEAEVPLPGPAVRVLDHSALLIFKDGKSLRWVHEILGIRSREAAESFGELSLPEGAELLSLYTRKADGRRLYAEETPEKETISLPDLDEGDYVVAIYMEPGDNGYIYNHGFLTPRVYFRGVDMPIYQQRFEVFPFGGAEEDVQRLGLGDDKGPAPRPTRLGARKGLRFDAEKTLLLPPEGLEVPAGLWLPSVRVGRKVSLKEDLDYLRDRLLARRRRTVAFDGWIDEILAEADEIDEADTEARLRALIAGVRGAVVEATGMTDHDVDRMRIIGRGNRAAVISVALEILRVPHRVLLSRPKIHVPSGPFLQAADFVYPLIEILPHSASALSPKGLATSLWLDPAPDRAPLGFIPFIMLGGEALQVWPPAPTVAPLALPTTRAVTDQRTLEVKARWAADGTLTGEVVDTLVGQEAIVVSDYLGRLTPEERPRLVERLLVGALGTAQVVELTDPLAGPKDGPLVLRYRFKASAADRLNLGLFPVAPARSYASLAERSIPMAIELPTDQRVHVVLESDRPMSLKARPGERRSGPHVHTLSVEAAPRRLELRSHLRVAGGQIDPSAYEAFAAWARSVDSAERVQIEVE